MAEYIDTGIRPDTITLRDTAKDRVIMRYECVPYRHFKSEIVEDINAETCKTIRDHLFSQGYTDILLLNDAFVLEAISAALREKAQAGVERKEGEG